MRTLIEWKNSRAVQPVDLRFLPGKAIKTGIVAGNTVLLQAYDVGAGSYTTFGTLSAHATDPTFKLSGVTLEGTILASGTVTMPALTLGGNLTITGQKIVTTNLSLYEEDSNTWALRNAADNAYKSLSWMDSYPRGDINFQTTGKSINARNATGATLLFGATDTGVGTITVAQLVGAADPYFSPGGGGAHKFQADDKIGLFGATPTAQQAHVIDPSGGSVQDAEARTAIAAINVILETIGIVATS